MKPILCFLLILILGYAGAAQKVGINTTSPQATLDVRGDHRLGGSNHFISYDTISGNIGWTNSHLFLPNNQQLIQHSASAEGLFYNNSALEYRNQVGTPVFSTNWSSGIGYFGNKLGIGQVNPIAPLSFSSIIGEKINLYGDSEPNYGIGIQGYLMQLHTDASASDIAFGYGGSSTFTENMRIKGDGKVGIGTSNPTVKLDVRNGSINTDSVYRIGTITVLAAPGSGNLFLGKNAGRINSGGAFNTFCGDQSGYSNTSGIYNSFFGRNAGYANTISYYNSFFGYNSGDSNTGSSNSFFGYGSGVRNTDGGANSFFGRDAAFFNTNGHSNSFFGMQAGFSNTSGMFNTAVGYSTDLSSGSFTNTTVIGANAVVDASNKVRIGNTGVTSIGGQVGWSTFSDGRFKNKVREDVQGLLFIKKLRPVSYQVDLIELNNYYSEGKPWMYESLLQQNKNNPSIEYRQSGFIAQEVEQAANELGFSFSGIDKPQNEKALYGLRYADFVVPIVKAVQEQQEMIEQQNLIINDQNNKIDLQQQQINDLLKEIQLIKEKLR